jgi:hypothetical protein
MPSATPPVGAHQCLDGGYAAECKVAQALQRQMREAAQIKKSSYKTLVQKLKI